MKKISTFLACFCYALIGLAQIEIPDDINNFWKGFAGPTERLVNGTQKIIDSVIFKRIDALDQLSLEKQNTFLYDSLGREIREFDSSFDINGDSLFFIDQTNTTYGQNQIIASTGRIEQSQYRNTNRKTESYNDSEVLLTTLEEVWGTNSNSFLPFKFRTNYFIDNTALVDSLLTQSWDIATQQWVSDRLDLQFFGTDELRDSVYSYQWNSTSNIWKLIGKFTSFYDNLGQQTNLNIYQWDNSINDFSLQIEIFEFYNGDAFKDSTHTYSYFGGYYNESATIFNYENDLVVSDTIYTWNDVQAQLLLANYQTYAYDPENDLVEQKTYAYDAIPNIFTPVTQINYYYSTIETPSVSLKNLPELSANCTFANPYSLNSPISCTLDQPESDMQLRLYDLQGRLHWNKSFRSQQSIHFAVEEELNPGFYILHLENKQGQIGHYKLLVPHQ